MGSRCIWSNKHLRQKMLTAKRWLDMRYFCGNVQRKQNSEQNPSGCALWLATW
jgi:hypothetical protein